jgi:regulator of sirC expression with transglutaminase-like and TPR domain
LATLCATGRAVGDEPAKINSTPRQIAQLIGQLDDESFRVRETANSKLLAIGRPALPALRAAAGNNSPEVRLRVRSLVGTIQREMVREGFARLAKQTDDAKIDLDEGMWLIATLVDPAADRQQIKKQLDALASRVQARIGKGVDAKTADPKKVVAALRHVLFAEEKFNGNTADYDHPDNSAIHKVLKTKRGLPILLSHVVVSVAERIGAPLAGIPIPGRYMVKYDGRRAPDGFAKQDIIINAFEGGRVMTKEDMKNTLGEGPSVVSYLTPSTHRATLVRMLTNLRADFLAKGKTKQAAQAYRCWQQMQSAAPDQ